MNMERLRARLIDVEGRRRMPYDDGKGNLTTGVGHNLHANPLSDKAIAQILDDDIMIASAVLTMKLPWWQTLDDVRQECLLELCFSMGWKALSGFTRTLPNMEAGNWAEAANGVLGSKWAKDVKAHRATTLANALRTGEWT